MERCAGRLDATEIGLAGIDTVERALRQRGAREARAAQLAVGEMALGPRHATQVQAGQVAFREQRLDQDGRLQLRSEEHTSELQSLMRISYAVFCLKKKKRHNTIKQDHT